MEQARASDFKYGILQDNKNINQLRQYIIEVHYVFYIDSQVALCVYDITNK